MTPLARIKAGLAAVRDFYPVYVGLGSKPEITAAQQQWPVHSQITDMTGQSLPALPT
jgi:hypothetical protein